MTKTEKRDNDRDWICAREGRARAGKEIGALPGGRALLDNGAITGEVGQRKLL